MTSPNDPPLYGRLVDADDLHQEQVDSARKQSIGERLQAGIDLFGLSCEFMRAGIRLQHPDADDDRVFQIVEERLVLARKLENGA